MNGKGGRGGKGGRMNGGFGGKGGRGGFGGQMVPGTPDGMSAQGETPAAPQMSGDEGI